MHGGAPCLYLFWETAAGLLEAGQVVRCLGAKRKRQRDRGSLRKELGRNRGEPRLLQVISGPAEGGLAPACLGGPEQKEPPGPGQRRKIMGSESLPLYVANYFLVLC